MRREDIVVEARGWIGTPYVHQQLCRGAGCDCLGLIRGVWGALGGKLPCQVPPYTMDWAEASGEETLWRAALTHLVPQRGQPMPGDILLFRMAERSVAKHVGIQAEIGEQASFVHAYSGHGVVESPLSLPWERRIVARFSFPDLT